MDTFDLYKLRYNLSNYLIIEDESFTTSTENFNYWNALFILILIIINVVILINYKELGLIAIFFIICCILFVYYCNKISIFLDKIKSNDLILNYSKYFKLVNAIFIESFNNLPSSNKYIYNYINNLIITKTKETTGVIKFTPTITDITDDIVRKILNDKSFIDYFNNFLNILIKIINNIKFNDNILNEDLQIFIEKNINDNNILKYTNISENNISFNLNKNLLFLKINENNLNHINFHNNYATYYTSSITIKNSSYNINEFIIQISNGNLGEYIKIANEYFNNVKNIKNMASNVLNNASTDLTTKKTALSNAYNINTIDITEQGKLLNIYNNIKNYKDNTNDKYIITVKADKLQKYSDVNTEYGSLNSRYEIINNEYKIASNNYDIANRNYKIASDNYDVANTNYETANNIYEKIKNGDLESQASIEGNNDLPTDIKLIGISLSEAEADKDAKELLKIAASADKKAKETLKIAAKAEKDNKETLKIAAKAEKDKKENEKNALNELNDKINGAYNLCDDAVNKALIAYNTFVNINEIVEYLKNIDANLISSTKDLTEYKTKISNINATNNNITKLNKLINKVQDYENKKKDSYLLLPTAISTANTAKDNANIAIDNLYNKIIEINTSYPNLINNIDLINNKTNDINYTSNVLDTLIEQVNEAKNKQIEAQLDYDNKLIIFNEAENNKNKAESDNNTNKDISKYYLINLEILDKCINETAIDTNYDLYQFLKNIYNDILKNFNNKYKINLIDFKILYEDSNILNNTNFKLKINELFKEFNSYINKILLISIYFLTVILHAFYTKILNPSHYISFLLYILIFIVFIIIFYSSIYSKLL